MMATVAVPKAELRRAIALPTRVVRQTIAQIGAHW